MKKVFFIIALFVSASVAAQGQFQNESAGMITQTAGKIMQLADAVPADKYNWSPEDDVRSFSGVFYHVVSANYFFATKLGATLPDGVNMETLEQDLKTKGDITPALKQSTDLITEAIKNVNDDALATKVEFPFPGDYTNTTAVLIALSHCNEHLGQLIAYSRMNGITPPWSKH
ncbi:MAG: DinB family protein [Cyclobacteriaceae bacterium]|nr:DinB family protein [Cyclobacteriaceae bacterium]MCK5371640.1 DinB family protein [Cyclobacteriaceae bacterium]